MPTDKLRSVVCFEPLVVGSEPLQFHRDLADGLLKALVPDDEVFDHLVCRRRVQGRPGIVARGE